MLLESEGFEVVGEAQDGASALTAAADLRPDLVLVDVHLPDFNGFDVAARLAEAAEPPEVPSRFFLGFTRLPVALR